MLIVQRRDPALDTTNIDATQCGRQAPRGLCSIDDCADGDSQGCVDGLVVSVVSIVSIVSVVSVVWLRGSVGRDLGFSKLVLIFVCGCTDQWSASSVSPN